MKTAFLMVILSTPPQAPPLTEAPVQAPPTVKDSLTVRPNCGCGYGAPCKCTDGCICEPLDYDLMSKRCAKERKPLVVFSGIAVRPIAGLTVCKGELPETGIIIGIPANGWLDRYDLPADISDDAIRAFIVSKMTTFGRKEVRQQDTSAMPQPFRFQQVFRSGGGGRRGASC